MIIDEININAPKIVSQKPLIEMVQELCEETEPKPVYCELPDELRLRPMEASGTVQAYTYTTSVMSSGASISTTTTL